jgi:hypothetical protein
VFFGGHITFKEPVIESVECVVPDVDVGRGAGEPERRMI